MVAECSAHLPGNRAHLLSGMLGLKQHVCLEFYAVVRGDNHLKVYSILQGKKPSLVWTKSGDSGPSWMRYRVEVKSCFQYCLNLQISLMISKNFIIHL